MIRELETLARLKPEVRKDIERYCDARRCAYSSILDADLSDENQRGKVHGLILHLARNNHSIKQIFRGAGVDHQYALKVINEARTAETPIKTTDWGRMATCRR